MFFFWMETILLLNMKKKIEKIVYLGGIGMKNYFLLFEKKNFFFETMPNLREKKN